MNLLRRAVEILQQMLNRFFPYENLKILIILENCKFLKIKRFLRMKF